MKHFGMSEHLEHNHKPITDSNSWPIRQNPVSFRLLTIQYKARGFSLLEGTFKSLHFPSFFIDIQSLFAGIVTSVNVVKSVPFELK